MINMYELTHDWWSMRANAWHEHVIPRLPRPFRWLELGSLEGRSAVWMLDQVMQKGDSLTCVDIWLHTFDGFSSEHAEDRFDRNIAGRAEKYKGKTHQFLVNALATNREFDGVYIDADHLARSVLEDSVLAWRLLPVGGIMVWDDYEWRSPMNPDSLPPKPAIDAFTAMYPIDVVYRGWQVIGIKRDT